MRSAGQHLKALTVCAAPAASLAAKSATHEPRQFALSREVVKNRHSMTLMQLIAFLSCQEHQPRSRTELGGRGASVLA